MSSGPTTSPTPACGPSGVAVTDSAGVTPVYQSGDANSNGKLDLGETWVFAATGTAIVGQYTNTGTATGTDATGTVATPVTSSEGDGYFGVQPGIKVVKLTNGLDNANANIAAGSNVIWTYNVTNTGDVALSNVTVTDNAAGVVPLYMNGDLNGNGLLDVGETWIYGALGTAVVGQYSNTGTATGTDATGTVAAAVSSSEGDGYFGVQPGIKVVKLTNGLDNANAKLAAGSSVTWTYNVTNTGNVALSGVAVTDSDSSVHPVLTSGDTNSNGKLDLGETWVFTAAGTAVAGQYTNTGTATGADATGTVTTPVTSSEGDGYFGVQPGIQIVKLTNGSDNNSAPGMQVMAGSTVTWTYDVTNTGNVALSSVTVTDTDSSVHPAYQSGDTNSNGLLDLGETWVYKATGTAIVGQYSNTGTATGKDSTGTVPGTVTSSDVDYYYGASQTPATKSGYVYIDNNNDGIKEAGEPGIAGVKIILTGTNDLGQSVKVTTTTDANGYYIFSGLRPGTYTVTEVQPGTTTSCYMYEWCSGSRHYFEMHSCNGSVYNYNCAPDAASVDACFSQMCSDHSSDFSNGITSQCNRITTSYLDGKTTAGSDGGTAGDNVISNIVLHWGDNGVNNNFGELLPASKSGYAYNDANNDGIKQSGECGISGVTVTLTGTDDQGNAVLLKARTDCNGAYKFTNLRPGTYTVTETQPSNYLDGKATAGTDGGTAGYDVIGNFMLASGTNGTGNNFGELKPASLSGFVYLDQNKNGVVDCTDTAIANVTVTLTGVDDRGNSVSMTDSTDSNGGYSFTSLRPGTYTITETQPSAYNDGVVSVGSQGGTAGVNLVTNISLQQGIGGVNNNFSELPSSTTGAIVTKGQTATIAFWNSSRGQNLIESLNGSCNAKQLSTWLAVNFPNMYGANAGSRNLTGMTNAQVADFFQNLYANAVAVNAQAMAVALACYVTNSTLAGGNYAASYGFVVNSVGTSTATYNIGSNGAAFGVANNTVLSIYQILQKTNADARNGILWDLDGNGSISSIEDIYRDMATVVFNNINNAGDIDSNNYRQC